MGTSKTTADNSLKQVNMKLFPEDFARADELVRRIGRPSNRTEVFRRALHLIYWAFVKKDAEELVVLRKGKEIGRMQWADSLPTEPLEPHAVLPP